jgi:hypothetical protein
MSPRRVFHTEEAKIVHLTQQFEPSYFVEYLLWTDLWRQDPDNGRGILSSRVPSRLLRGAGIFWEVLDREREYVQALTSSAIFFRLQQMLREREEDSDE